MTGDHVPSVHVAAAAVWRQAMADLRELAGETFAVTDPTDLPDMHVPVRVRYGANGGGSRVVPLLDEPAPVSSDAGSCIEASAADGSAGTVTAAVTTHRTGC